MPSRKAFTLIEILLVIAIIAILASIVIAAINPGKQLADARNAQRRSDVFTILNAVYQYAIDHQGALPGEPPDTIDLRLRHICVGKTVSCGNANEAINLDALTGAYLVALPVDPSVPTGSVGTAYIIYKNTTNRITVSAPKAERSATIDVSR